MILITGANGQLGTELRYLLDERNEEYVAVDVAEMDITNAEMVDKVFSEVKPTLVYHCAAYTAVDAAEDEGKELDYAINVTGTENVAKAAAKYDATLVYISTDYVFDGEKPVGEEWEVDDTPDPQTEYGRTKRMGEELVEKYAKIVSPLKKITPHKLRSTFGTNLYRETGDIYVVADVLGHKDVNTTKKHYAAISDEIRRQASTSIKLREKPDNE